MEKFADNKKRKPRPLLIFLVILTILVFVGKNYYDRQFLAVDPNNLEEIEIEIPQGSTSKGIADILYDTGLIRNKYIFRKVAKDKKLDNKLKAGNYKLDTSMDVYSILDQLTKGSKNENVVRFTIPEGYEIKQIAEKLAQEGLVDKDKFLELTSNKNLFQDKHNYLKEIPDNQGLEGFLFPSTYEVYIGASEEEIIDKMLSQFGIIYENDIRDNMDKYSLSLNELITLASIIEREARLDEERELISAVFHNRLEQGMLLQSCATVQYVLGERKEVLTEKETQIESDFNTYIHQGLPPHPIAAPGKMSIIAALNPADVDYLFFRTREDGTGGHIFSRTYEEHQKANPNK